MTISTAADYDGGSESPTQVNEGRSYDQYEDPASLSSNSLAPTQEAGDDGDDFLARSLDENESGAVRFGSLRSNELDFESPTAASDGFGRRRSDADGLNRFFPATASTGLLDPATPAPLPRNPFAGKFQTPLVGGSQLFATTPSSAAVLHDASPTSSRPSPTGLLAQAAAAAAAAATTPLTHGSSPAKHRFSNLGEQTPMPAVLFHTLSSPSTTTRYNGVTPRAPDTVAPDSAAAAAQPPSSASPVARRRRAPPAPMAEYEPMRQSQARRDAAAKAQAGMGSSSDDDADEVARQRRRRVQQKRDEATRILGGISISGPTLSGDVVEVPASVKKDLPPRSQGSRGLLSNDRAAGFRSSAAYDDASFPQSVIDAPTPRIFSATKTPSSSAAGLPEMARTSAEDEDGRPALPPKSSLNEIDAVPETSPAGKRHTSAAASRAIVLSTSDAVDAGDAVDAVDAGEAHLLTSSSAPPNPRYSPTRNPSPATTDAGPSSPPGPASSPARAGPPQRKKARYGRESEPRRGRPLLAASVSSRERSASSLSVLSATPAPLSREGTPITANDSDRSGRASDKARHALRGRRRQRGETPTLEPEAELEPSSARKARSLRRVVSPVPSGSTDELSASPATLAAPSRSMRASRRSTRSASTKPLPPQPPPPPVATASLRAEASARASAAPSGLFAGMVFGVSLQSQRPGEDNRAFARREKQGTDLQARIQEAGGRILRDGFEDLFRPPQIVSSTWSRARAAAAAAGAGSASDAGGGGGSSISGDLQLLPRAADSGFTALIIDGHSRKAKYMQALALGLPCLAPRWVTTCLDRGALVDWAPYLLCAGASSYLGGALRSRTLAPYDAASARLADVVRRRPRLMGGLTILVVPGGGRAADKTRDQYTFLAHVLGASLSQAHNLQEAREHLRAMEEAGRPCDWVYVGEKPEVAGLFADRRARPSAKKRKRPSAAAAAAENDTDRAPAPVKLLSDERFIQSLILGQLIEDDDLGGL